MRGSSPYYVRRHVPVDAARVSICVQVRSACRSDRCTGVVRNLSNHGMFATDMSNLGRAVTYSLIGSWRRPRQYKRPQRHVGLQLCRVRLWTMSERICDSDEILSEADLSRCRRHHGRMERRASTRRHCADFCAHMQSELRELRVQSQQDGRRTWLAGARFRPGATWWRTRSNFVRGMRVLAPPVYR